MTNLNTPQTTNLAMKYADSIAWSNQKIARDMLQNFYDGHGQTLNGVKMILNEMPNGNIKVQIEGKGLFSPNDITLIGDGNKIEDLSNAGGFGEGAKVMICKMLRTNKADNVKFRCADWSTLFTEGIDEQVNKVLMRELRQEANILNGNTIEFETKSRRFVNALMNAINYFNHAKNPDYRNLSFDSPDFGFKLLKSEEKGNLYLTQRFEIGENEHWDNAVEHLSIIFKKKPDVKELEKVTGYKFRMNRDRTKLTPEEVQHLTHYFAHKTMTNEQLM